MIIPFQCDVRLYNEKNKVYILEYFAPQIKVSIPINSTNYPFMVLTCE